VTEGMGTPRWRGCGEPLWDTEGRGADEGCSVLVGVRNLSCRGCDRYLAGIQDGLGCTVSHSRGLKRGYGRQEEYLVDTQCVRLFGTATEVSGGLGGRLQSSAAL
jgi:hypothetical protein